MRMRGIFLAVPLCATAFASTSHINLGTTEAFALLSAETLTNTGASVITGDLGLYPGLSVTGFPPGTLVGTQYLGDAVAEQAQMDLTTAYLQAAGEACDTDLTGQDLGGLTLLPGAYCFSSSAQLTGTLTLDAAGDPNAVFLIQIGSTLTTASASSVVFTNGGRGDNLFWQVGMSATLGTTTTFTGTILAHTSITLNTGANVGCGRLLAQSGAITLDTNVVDIGSCDVSEVPEPGSASLLGVGLLLGLIAYWKASKRAAAAGG